MARLYSKSQRKKKEKKIRVRTDFPFARILFLGIVLLVLAGSAVYGVKHFFLRSAFFLIKEVLVNKTKDYDFNDGEKDVRKNYLGKNIFTVDLKKARLYISNKYPELKKVEVRRVLPDVLEINIIARRPLAVIEGGQKIIIDREGVVLPFGAGAERLIVIKGSGFFLTKPARGVKLSNGALEKALTLIGGLEEKMLDYKNEIEFVDVSDRGNVVFGMKGVAVKMGTSEFSDKIVRLRGILQNPKIDFKGIKYIDLRFDDVVISPK